MTRKVCFISGASGGIGAACARAFAGAGYDLVLHYSSSPAAIEAVQKDCEALGARCLLQRFDVRDEAAIKAAMDESLAVFDTIDVLINNAGITRDGLMLRMSRTDFDDVLAVNLSGAFLLSQAVLKPMMKQRQGVILNMSSIVGVSGNAGQVNYAASKAGLIGLTKSMAKEVASRNIRVNAIAPGFIETAMTAGFSEEQRMAMQNNIPLKRFGQSEEVAQLALFLASDQASYITAQTVMIDGGLASGGLG